MKKTALYQEYLERQKAKKTEVKVNYYESVTQKRLDANPQWGFKNIAELNRTIGLPASANTPLVRWSNRLPHGPEDELILARVYPNRVARGKLPRDDHER